MDVITSKAATIERCMVRIREEYRNPNEFMHSYTRQDAAILNIQRAAESALDMGQHIIRKHKLGLPQSAREIFQILRDSGWITKNIAQKMQKMVGFRNIAVHEYQSLQIPIVVDIIENHLDNFLEYSRALVLKESFSNQKDVRNGDVL